MPCSCKESRHTGLLFLKNGGCLPMEMNWKSRLRFDRKTRKLRKTVLVFSALWLLPFATVVVMLGQSRAHDPGVRSGSAGSGGAINGLTADQQSYFAAGKEAFMEIDSVQGETLVPGTGAG